MTRGVEVVSAQQVLQSGKAWTFRCGELLRGLTSVAVAGGNKRRERFNECLVYRTLARRCNGT